MIKKVKKLWGSEEWLVNNELYCAKFLNLKKGFQCSLHYHKVKDETFYILEGTIELQVEGRYFKLLTGMERRIRPFEAHRFKALSQKAKMLEVSSHHDDEDSYRLEKSIPIIRCDTTLLEKNKG